MAYSIAHLHTVFDRLGGLKAQMIHLAGSKGKGTTAALLAHALRFYGLKVGLFSSPAVRDLCECIWIDGQSIAPADLDTIQKKVCAAAAAEGTSLSEFEALTLAAFYAFNAAGCDHVVVECGMGGQHDATNVVPHKKLTILTHVELEHTAELGDTLSKITREKIGIARPNTPLLSLRHQAPEVLDVLMEAKSKVPVDLRWAEPRTLGWHHPSSVGLASAALEILGFSPNAAVDELWRDLHLPGRFEILELHTRCGAPLTVILDGAHTRDSVRDFLTRLEKWRDSHQAPPALFGVHFLSDKAPDLVDFFPIARSQWIPLPSEARAGQKPEQWTSVGLSTFLSTARDAQEPTLVVLCGSFRLIHAAYLELESKL